MKFSIASEEFARAVATTSKVAAKGDTRELASLLFEATDGMLTVMATDMDTSVKITCPAVVEDPGCALLPAVKLSKMAHTLPKKPVTVEAAGNDATLKCGRVRFALPALDADDFPGVRTVEGDELMLAADDFAKIARGVAPMASSDVTRGVLQAVRFECEGGMLTAAATDTYKLAAVTVPHEGAGFTADVPAALFALVKPDGDVTMKFGGNCISAATRDIEHTERCIIGTYPRWRALMRKLPAAATVDVKELKATANRASIVSKYIDFALAGGKLTLSARDDGGQIIDELDVVQSGDDMEFTLDATLLMSALNAFDGKTAELLQSDRPVLLHDGATDALVMTMRR